MSEESTTDYGDPVPSTPEVKIRKTERDRARRKRLVWAILMMLPGSLVATYFFPEPVLALFLAGLTLSGLHRFCSVLEGN